MKTLLKFSLAVIILLSAISCKKNKTSTTNDLLGVNSENTLKITEIKSANILEFGNNNVLFLGDSKTGTIYAIETQAGENKSQGYGYNLNGFDKKVAEFLNVDNDNILFKDLATHPKSGEAYISLSVIQKGTYIPVILIANQGGEIRQLDLENAKYTKLKLPNTPVEEFKFWDDVNARNLTITDMDFHNGKLYISGLSNKDFASTLRIADYPFNDKVSVSNINQKNRRKVKIQITKEGENVIDKAREKMKLYRKILNDIITEKEAIDINIKINEINNLILDWY